MGESDSFASDSDDMSNQTHSIDSSSSEESQGFSSDTEEEEDKGPEIIRIYDARFKIPAQSNLGQLMAAKGNDLQKGQSNK